MDKARLNALIDAYIDNFDMINDPYHNENMKWAAIYHYKENFDINAPDFYEMFKYAMSKSSIIINNGTTQPVNGILKLISHEQEAMRGLFTMLYEDDGGDLDKRQGRIEHFVEATNQLLDKYERGKWKYKQEFRSALAYLVFYKPEENYLYKSSQCQPFFRYLDYSEELGYGQYFKLARYYRMCDEVRQELTENQELMLTHEKRWAQVGNPKDDLRILTFDIIYCSIVYGFYKYQDYSKIRKKSKATLVQEKYETRIEALSNEIEKLEAQLFNEQQRLDDIPEICVENLQVKHRMFGAGQVTKQRGTCIEVSFAQRQSVISLTEAFHKGILVTDDSTIAARCTQYETILSACERIKTAIRAREMEIELLTKKLRV